MPVTNAESWFGLLQKSRLLSPPQWEQAKTIAGDDPQTIAQAMVHQGLLTVWQAQQLLAGRHAFFLGKYKLLEKLGEGGMGAVYKAVQTTTGRFVALKVMSENVVKQPGAVSRFHREIRAVAALEHPNIVAAYDADQVGETHFLVMEYAAGRDLKEWIKEFGRLPIDWSCECIRQAALGLQHAHERGLAHRDIKPSNILVVSSECTPHAPREEQDLTRSVRSTLPIVKILDMGLARFTSETQCTILTQTGQVLGTIDYISPEQAKDTRGAGIQADIFSLGASLFHMLCGQVPFTGKNPMEKLMARAMRDASRANTLRPDIPAELDAIIARMLARKVDDRFQTPDEVARVLAPFCLGASSEQCTPHAPREDTRLTRSVRSTLGPIEAEPDATLNRFLNELGDTAEARKAEALDAPGSTGKMPVPHGMGILPTIATGGRETAGEDHALAVEIAAAESAVGPASRAGPEHARVRLVKRIAAAALVLLAVGIGIVWQFSGGREVSSIPKTAPKSAYPPIDLVKLIDPKRDAVEGEWKFEGGKLVVARGTYGRLMIRFRPPDEYDLTIQAERKAGNGSLNFGILAAGRQAIIGLDAWGGTVRGLHRLDGLGANNNESTTRGAIFPLDKPVSITCEVRKSSILVRSGDTKLIDWKGDLKRLSLGAEWAVPDQSVLFLASSNSSDGSFHIHSAILTPLSGPGEIVTPASAVDETFVKQVAGQPPQEQIRLVVEKLKQVNPGFDGYLSDPGLSEDRTFVQRFSVRNKESVRNLWPIKAFPRLASVRMEHTSVSDLSLLASFSNLTVLNVHSSPVSSLAPLRGMKLTTLSCTHTLVSDLSPLAGMPLDTLNCSNSTKISDLRPLAGMPLVELNCGGTEISRLEPLRGMTLTRFDCGRTKVTDLEPLRGMKLTHLNCEFTKVSDLSPLTGMPLTELWISGNPSISSLEPLRGMKLTLLHSGSSNITDLSPLSGMPLAELACNNTSVSSLEPLRGMKLTRDFNCSKTPISSLDPLKGMKVARLWCNETKVTDLSPISGMPLTDLHCDETVAHKQAELLKSIKTLQRINDVPVEDFWKRVTGAPRSQGYALEFDGKSAQVHTPLKYDGSHPLTIEGWVKPKTTNYAHVFSDHEVGGIALSLDSRWLLVVRDALKNHSTSAVEPARPDEWVHLAGVYTGESATLFVAGKQQRRPFPVRMTPSRSPFRIGCEPDGNQSASFFSGVIDEVRFSNVARYQADFAPSRRFTNDEHTLALYHFDEGTGGEAKDSSGHNRHGQVIGAKWLVESSAISE